MIVKTEKMLTKLSKDEKLSIKKDGLSEVMKHSPQITDVCKLVPSKFVRDVLREKLWNTRDLIKPKSITNRPQHQIKVSGKMRDVWLFKATKSNP